MTVLIEGNEWAQRAAALAHELVAAGKLTSPQWHKAVLEVPRHVFVPSYYEAGEGSMVAADATGEQGRARWLDAVYSNTALVTKLAQDANGAPPEFLSSSSTPGLMTRMLEALDVHEGQRVLEIGTGTGYNAALLCHRLGAANVFSVDIEPDLVDLARVRLAELGYHPTLVTADGVAGLPEHAPFDRIIATCSVPVIPWSWVEQTMVGGIILTDIKRGLNAGNLVRLTRLDLHRAEGRFDAGQAAFMSLRHTPGAGGRVPYTRAPHDNPITEHTTTLDPRTPWTNPVVWFLTALRIGPHYRMGYTGGDPRHGPEADVPVHPGWLPQRDHPCPQHRRHPHGAPHRTPPAVVPPRRRPPTLGRSRPPRLATSWPHRHPPHPNPLRRRTRQHHHHPKQYDTVEKVDDPFHSTDYGA